MEHGTDDHDRDGETTEFTVEEEGRTLVYDVIHCTCGIEVDRLLRPME